MSSRRRLLLPALVAACADPPAELRIVVQRDAVGESPSALVGAAVHDAAIVEREQLYTAPGGAEILDAATSPDGRWLAFAVGGGNDPGVFVVDAHDGHRTKIADSPGTDGLYFAPHDAALVFDAPTRFVVPLGDGVGTPVQVQDDPAETMPPVFAREADAMVFVDPRADEDALVLVTDIASSPIATTATRGSRIEELELTPDGRIASLRRGTTDSDYLRLFALDLAGDLPSDVVQVVEVEPDDAVFGPVIPPDGSGIVATVATDFESTARELRLEWAELVDGELVEARVVAELDPRLGSASAFTPDGRWLIVSASDRVALARVEPTGEWPLFPLPFVALDAPSPRGVQVSADSRWLFAVSEAGALMRVAIDGDAPGEPERLDDGLGALQFAIVPDGTRVAFGGGSGDEAGFYLHVDGHAPARIDDGLRDRNFDLALASDGHTLVFQNGSLLVSGAPAYVDIGGAPHRAAPVLRADLRGRFIGFFDG